jgi:hypothetical protein
LLRKTDRVWPLLSTLLVGVYFVAYTRGAWQAYFSDDDVTNLYRSWIFPLSALFKANVLFFLNSPFFRPLASAWYRVIFFFAGFHPLPFHIANLVILGGNIWLTYCLVRRLTRSPEIGLASALLISYHPRFGSLYFDTGFVFDVLCYLFYFGAMLYYVRIRQQGRGLSTGEVAAVTGLYICALNSKEMAVTLPAFLFLYEVLYQRVRDWRCMFVTGVLTVVFAVGRFLGHSDNSLLTVGAYRPVFSWDQFMKTSANFFGDLLIQDQPVTHATVLVIWAAMLAAAVLLKSRTLQFAWLFLMISPIPVAFILPRGAPQYYVAFFGWVLYAATAFVRAIELLLDRIPALPRPARGLVLLLLLASLLYPVYGNTGFANISSVSLEGEQLRLWIRQLHDLRPILRPRSRILFLDDPTDDIYRMQFLLHLSYQDPSFLVARAKTMNPFPDADKIASYDYVFDYRVGHFFNSAQRRPVGPEPVIEFEWGKPAVFHSGFVPVTPQNPAKPDEVILAMVSDLGETVPPTPLNQPFSQNPLVDVAGPVAIRMGGKPARVVLKIGWPEKINMYRVDFHVPKDIGHGEAATQVSAGGVTGPEVMIPVE